MVKNLFFQVFMISLLSLTHGYFQNTI